jgi:hypothetical protein
MPPSEAEMSPNSLSWTILQVNSFVLTILQRSHVCNLMKTRILHPKYGWGGYSFPPEQTKLQEGQLDLQCRLPGNFARDSWGIHPSAWEPAPPADTLSQPGNKP